MTIKKLVEFCRAKEAEALRLADARTDMAESWRSGTNAEWRANAKLTGVEYVTLKRRTLLAERDSGIAAKYLDDAETYAQLRARLLEHCGLTPRTNGDGNPPRQATEES